MQQLEVIIRRPLYQLGLEYGHGSTHGTGVFLGVHEGNILFMLYKLTKLLNEVLKCLFILLNNSFLILF